MQNNPEIPKDYILKYEWLDISKSRDVKCALCDGNHQTEDVFSFQINERPMHIRRCIQDDLMFLYPQPAGDYAETLYNHPGYFTGEDDMYGLSVSPEKSSEIAKIRIEEIKNILKDKNISELSFLEIGSAYGHTLVEAKTQGFKEVCGIEFSREAVAASKAKDLDVKLASANESLDSLFAGMQFDVIAMYSVLEHVDNPVIFLERSIGLLKKDGIFVIRVPRMSALGPWLSLLDHYWHFTEDSLRALALRFGLQIIEVFPSGVFVGVQHEGRLSSMTLIAKKII